MNFWKYDETENTLWYLATLSFMKPQHKVMCFCVISVAFYDDFATFSESEKENLQTWILVCDMSENLKRNFSCLHFFQKKPRYILPNFA